MKRLVYQPKVNCLIMRDSALKGKTPAQLGETDKFLIDVSDDIVSGTVNRRLNAMSDISITLQNKRGRYTQNNIIEPMDRIILTMCRVGSPFLVFSGFIDDAPFYQMYPGTVTISASDTLKLLHNTYFDPGLMAVLDWFQQHGWNYNAGTGALEKFGTDGTPGGGVGNDDIYGHMGDLIHAMLTDIANWPSESIAIYGLPDTFFKAVSQLFADITADNDQTQQESIRLMDSLFGGLGTRIVGGGNPAGGTTPGATGTPGNPTGGNANAEKIAQIAQNAGFTGEGLVTAIAIALAESGGITNNMNYNGDGSYDVGLWQVNTGAHTPGGGGTGLPAPPGGDFSGSPAEIQQEWLGVKPHCPANVQTFVEQCFDPDFNAQQAYGISNHGTSWSQWFTYDGPNPPYNSAYRDHLDEAAKAVAALSAPTDPNQGTSPSSSSWRDNIPSGPADPSSTTVLASDPSQLDEPPSGFHWVKVGEGKYQLQVGATPGGGSDGGGSDGVNRQELDATIRDKVVQVAYSQLGVKEIGGENRGPDVEKYLAYAHAGPGDPWCAAFVQWCFGQAGREFNDIGITASTSTFQNMADHGWAAATPRPGDIVYYGSEHTGIVVGYSDGQVTTIEGNTSDPAGVGGEGVYLKKKPLHGGGGSDNIPGNYISVPGIGTTTINYTGTGPSSPVNPTGSQSAAGLTTADIAALGAQGYFYAQQFQASDSSLSNSLSGQRALSNDQPVIEWIDTAVTASGRVYCTMPTGKFLAFFPDRWGFFERTPYFYINDIEIIDLVINKNDTNLVTHVFTTGPHVPTQDIDLFDRMQASVASVEDAGFKYFIGGNDPRIPNFDPVQFLAHYGARPYVNDLTNINNKFLTWMHGWMKFLEFWSQRYTTTAQFTFMPELFPGGLVSFGNRVQMFLESVTHNFDMAGGFTTTAELSSLRGLSLDNDLPDPILAGIT